MVRVHDGECEIVVKNDQNQEHFVLPRTDQVARVIEDETRMPQVILILWPGTKRRHTLARGAHRTYASYEAICRLYGPHSARTASENREFLRKSSEILKKQNVRDMKGETSEARSVCECVHI